MTSLCGIFGLLWRGQRSTSLIEFDPRLAHPVDLECALEASAVKLKHVPEPLARMAAHRVTIGLTVQQATTLQADEAALFRCQSVSSICRLSYHFSVRRTAQRHNQFGHQ